MKRRGFFGLLAGLLAAIGLGKPETPGITIDKPGLTVIMKQGTRMDLTDGSTEGEIFIRNDRYTSLAKAAEAARPGDTIFVVPGSTYGQPCNLRAKITFKGHA